MYLSVVLVPKDELFAVVAFKQRSGKFFCLFGLFFSFKKINLFCQGINSIHMCMFTYLNLNKPLAFK